ncbi:MAG TPA: energy-coupling factor transporter transmembrane protein EcfT [Candidatus Fimadaptatus faecigallinarum]|uniref:Energy-coupling factor transporter transmembrane protein EcfT n=1 Tax=Candidatus Fimadaptatus faecigallinarum TaxID=2840814 RepID=A0A9D1S4H5_9FIRM|nr:energy-coupling factor transporter transmembrane protein EcfT [Candidatus Fimadaptatus faecigallinarum]
MIQNITLGQYFPGDSFLHRLDPRMKLIITLALIVLVFFVKGLIGYALLYGLIIGCAAFSRISPKFLIKGMKPILFIIALTFVLNALFASGDTVWLSWGFLTITREGVTNAVFMALRLVFLMICTQLMTLTTSPIALTDALERLMKPLKKIGFPAHELAMMMSIALRFIPTLLEETDKIMKAQSARGADFETGNLLRRAKAMVPLLVPLFVSAFRRADELALAMEARCYHGGRNRTRMKQLHMSRLDVYAALAVAGLAVLVALEGFLYA